MPEPINREINPRVFDQTIGIKDLRNIKIYPLSVGHQLELSEMISEAVAAFVSMVPEETEQGMVQFVSFVIGLIKKNINKIISYITEEDEGILEEIDNDQLSEIIEKVYRINFEGPVKNVMSLFQPVGEETTTLPPSKKSVQPSVRRTATN